MSAELEHKTVLIMAGGTGGHVFPAMAIADFLQNKNVKIHWLGTEPGLESTVVPATGIPLHLVSIGGLRGKNVWRKLFSPIRIARAIYQSWVHIRRIKPDCVLGMGGFVTGPGGMAAWLSRVPLIIHEQNAIAGFTNLMLLPFSTVAMAAFPGAFQRKKELDNSLWTRWITIEKFSIPVVGNPVRKAIFQNSVNKLSKSKPARTHVLIVGGSLGAVAINQVVPEVVAAFEHEECPVFWHQCGDKNLQNTLAVYEKHGLNLVEDAAEGSIRLTRFIKNMAEAYAWADIVICRAGALTVSEITSAGVASILIPYPHAVDDHQTENARYLVDNEAAYLLPQNKLNNFSLFSLLNDLIGDSEKLKAMSKNAWQLSMPEACEKASAYCLEACHG